MKTTKLISALSLALILLGTSVAYAGNPQSSSLNSNANLGIRYQVNIHLTDLNLPNNAYIIQLLDQTGRPAAPSQKFRPGVTLYNFYEAGPVNGVRVARMVPAPNIDRSVGLPNLFCRPDVKTGPFGNGRSYSFELFPHTTSPDKD